MRKQNAYIPTIIKLINILDTIRLVLITKIFNSLKVFRVKYKQEISITTNNIK